jgi:hypothetical protein
VLIFANSWLQSVTYHIKQDGTGNFTTIQEGINASSNSDTVLVYTGTYFENIDFIGKNITVASLFLTTNDESYISQTIIDGNGNGSVVSIISGEDETTLLCGFTIQNGTGTLYVQDFYGGGIYCLNSSPIIRKCLIKGNSANGGGGIYIKYSHPTLKGVTITDNHAFSVGGGIYITHDSTISFDTDELCNIYLNYGRWGCEFSKSWILMEPVTVIVDTFTVLEPDYYFISSTNQYGVQQNDVTLFVQNAKLEPVNADLYVSPQGSNNNIGLTSDDPLQTINYAYSSIVSDSLNPHTIHLADGVYSKSLNDQKFPLNLRGYVSLIGESMENTIFDAEGESSFICAQDNDFNFEIRNINFVNGYVIDSNYGISIIIQNPNFFDNRFINFENLIFENNIYESYFLSVADMNINMKNVYFLNNQGGSQIRFWFTNDYETASIENMVIKDCSQYTHPDIFSATPVFLFGATDDDPYQVTMKNVLIADNEDMTTEWTLSCSAISANFSINLDLINCTIGNNFTPGSTGEGAAIFAGGVGSTFNIVNSIIYGNLPDQVYLMNDGPEEPLTINIYNSLIEGGEPGVFNPSSWNTVNWLEGNLDTDPLWIGTGEYPYMLSDESPCINAGTPDTTGLNLPEFDLAGNPRIVNGIVDMGAYECQDTSGVYNYELKVNDYELNNYPNPFNPVTTISYNLPYDVEDAIIEIYNIRGQLIDKIEINSELSLVSWYAERFSSGIYLYKFNIANSPVKKMILIK